MKFAISLLTALTVFPSSLAQTATNLPQGAHDARPAQPRPNICDDKCDVAFAKLMAQCGGAGVKGCVEKARRQTCLRDYSVCDSPFFWPAVDEQWWLVI